MSNIRGADQTAWARRSCTPQGLAPLAEAHRCRAHRFIYRAKSAHHPARSGWFATLRVHISECPERGLIAKTTPDRLLPERTALIQCRSKHGGAIARSWITDLPAGTPLATLVRHATNRWHIESDYRETEQALGLGDYEDAATADCTTTLPSSRPPTCSVSNSDATQKTHPRPEPVSGRCSTRGSPHRHAQALPSLPPKQPARPDPPMSRTMTMP